MKGSANQSNNQSKAPAINNNRPRPDNKDNMDSRKNLELNDEPTGHNKKEVHNGTKDEHNETMGSRPNDMD